MERKLFATQALSQTQKNVSEPQTGIKPATYWSLVRRSNHWATRSQMAERRPRYVPVRKRDMHMHVLLNSSLDMSVYLINEYQICMKDDLQLGKLKENCLLLKLYHKQKNVSEPQTGIEPAIFWSPVRRSISSETVRLISGETFLGLRNIFLSLR